MPKRIGMERILFTVVGDFVIHKADCMHNVLTMRPDEAHRIENILP